MEVELFHRTTVHHPIGLWVKGCGVDVEDPQDGGQLGSQCSYFRETKENGEDIEDLAGHNIFLTVALAELGTRSLFPGSLSALRSFHFHGSLSL